MTSSIEQRFWAKVQVGSETECWPWTGARIPNGYGSFGGIEVNGRKPSQVGAHRVSFFLTNGYWPRIARHICDNPPCVNPSHLLDGDAAANTRDMLERGRCAASKRTHCPQGHAYDDANTYRDKNGHRKCRACMRAATDRFDALRRERDPEGERAKANARSRAYARRKRAAAKQAKSDGGDS